MKLTKPTLLASLALAAFTAAANPVKPIYEMNADGEVQIGPDGHVTDYRLNSPISPELAALVDKNVRSWQFEPILIDKQPVLAKTRMHLHLRAEPSSLDDTLKVRITEVQFGQPQRTGTMKPPHYPQSAISAHLGAKVLLNLHLDDNGNVIAVEPYQTSLNARTQSEHQAEQWRKEFERASVIAAKQWQFNLTESFAGKPLGTTVLVPVVYSLYEQGQRPGDDDSKWKGYVPGPIHPATWLKDARVADNIDVSTIKEGDALPMESRFHLKNNVIDKTL